MSLERLWWISAALRRRGLRRTAPLVKKINSLIYHNSLAPGAQFSRDVRFGDHGFGTMIHSNVVAPHQASVRIGRGARIGAGAVVTKDVPQARPS